MGIDIPVKKIAKKAEVSEIDTRTHESI